ARVPNCLARRDSIALSDEDVGQVRIVDIRGAAHLFAHPLRNHIAGLHRQIVPGILDNEQIAKPKIPLWIAAPGLDFAATPGITIGFDVVQFLGTGRTGPAEHDSATAPGSYGFPDSAIGQIDSVMTLILSKVDFVAEVCPQYSARHKTGDW